MKLFECDNCGQVLFFENTSCMSCKKPLGYCFEAARLVVLPEAPQQLAATFKLPGKGSEQFRRCKNYVEHDACNWLVSGSPDKVYCRSCELTEVIPDLSEPTNVSAWVEIERAKRRLLYTLAALKLPITSRLERPGEGLAFRFLRSTEAQPVMTGHSGGIITLNIAEADAAFRENQREKLGEAYRTVLGHLRHEIGHYYWDRLLRNGSDVLERFRSIFGDERQGYQQAIARHYSEGPPEGWSGQFISAYASMHPWEDWAESWAHYLHMVDTLETAKCHGLALSLPNKAGVHRVHTDGLAFRDFEQLAESWHVVTIALNGLSRSMGLKDAYPFVLSSAVYEKLRFIHDLVQERPSPKSARSPKSQRAKSATPGARA